MIQMGEYTLLTEGKESPLGRLILAEHRILKRKAALKQLAFLPDEDSLREIASLASLEHPHLARLQNVGIKGDTCYFAYDWLSSSEEPCQNLREYLEKEPSEAEIWQIAFQIGSALDKIHLAGMVHVGIKLSNVLIDESSGSPLS